MPVSEAPAAPKLQRPDGLSLTVKDSHGNTIFFAVKKTTRMCKLIQAYAEKVGMHESKVRFIYDGDRVSPWATPEDVSMELHMIWVGAWRAGLGDWLKARQREAAPHALGQGCCAAEAPDASGTV